MISGSHKPNEVVSGIMEGNFAKGDDVIYKFGESLEPIETLDLVQSDFSFDIPLVLEKNKKSYPSAEFLSIVDSYDFAINYLFNLKNEESTDIYGDDAIQKDLEEFLKKMKIIIKSENRKDEDDSRTEKE